MYLDLVNARTYYNLLNMHHQNLLKFIRLKNEQFVIYHIKQQQREEQNLIDPKIKISKKLTQNQIHIRFFTELDKFTASPRKLLYIYQKINQRKLKKISKDLFSKNTTTKLNNIAPLYLDTSQILHISLDQQSIIINHTSHPENIKQNVMYNINRYVNKFEQFTQQFVFKGNKILYQCILSHKRSDSVILAKLIFKFAVQSIKPNIDYIQQQEIQIISQTEPIVNIEPINSVCFNEQFNRVNRLTTKKQKWCLQQMKKRFSDAPINHLCRFLMAKNFDVEIAINSYQKYIQWKNSMAKYTLADFQDYVDAGYYKYIGKDKCGRPVLLSMTARAIPDQLDWERFSLFYLYYLQIFLPTKMEGYVDQFIVIADFKNFSTANFKFSLMSRNLNDCTTYCPQRQYKLMAVNTGWFATVMWSIIKPITPKKTAEKVDVVGSDVKTILNALLNQMDIDVIPDWLGGKNKVFEENSEY